MYQKKVLVLLLGGPVCLLPAPAIWVQIKHPSSIPLSVTCQVSRAHTSTPSMLYKHHFQVQKVQISKSFSRLYLPSVNLKHLNNVKSKVSYEFFLNNFKCIIHFCPSIFKFLQILYSLKLAFFSFNRQEPKKCFINFILSGSLQNPPDQPDILSQRLIIRKL